MKNFKKALIVVSMISTLSAVAAFAEDKPISTNGVAGGNKPCEIASDATQARPPAGVATEDEAAKKSAQGTAK